MIIEKIFYRVYNYFYDGVVFFQGLDSDQDVMSYVFFFLIYLYRFQYKMVYFMFQKYFIFLVYYVFVVYFQIFIVYL